MKYSQDIRQFESRMRLLQIHLEEQLEYLIAEKEVHYLLRAKHEQQRNRLESTQDPNRLELACLIERQTNEVSRLACSINQDRQAMSTRQAKEELQFEQQINQGQPLS